MLAVELANGCRGAIELTEKERQGKHVRHYAINVLQKKRPTQ